MFAKIWSRFLRFDSKLQYLGWTEYFANPDFPWRRKETLQERQL